MRMFFFEGVRYNMWYLLVIVNNEIVLGNVNVFWYFK